MSTKRIDDIWSLSPSAAAPPGSTDFSDTPFQIKTFDDFAPLDSQSDAALETLKPVYELLFGEVNQPKTHNGGEMPVLETFAILDGAKVMNLPDLLQGSGLEHCCLFKGQAFEDMGEVAPWLVKLDPQKKFTRNLFVSSEIPWHLWRCEAGIFCRSFASMEKLQTHFRKFTKIMDDAGSSFYFRFWEPSWAVELLSIMTTEQASTFFSEMETVVVAKQERIACLAAS